MVTQQTFNLDDAPASMVFERLRFQITPSLPSSDGSVDLWMGPTAPKGWARNWLLIDANGRFELMARFYGPEPVLLDQSWRLLDLERMS